jgi:serine/threonine-protein kinase
LGETVTVWFSGGPSIIAVPNVTGMNEQQARNVLQEAGLTVGEITAVFSPDQPAGNVVSTQPDRGIAVNPGDVVSLFVSNGLVDLPNLTGRTLSEAQAVLSELWLPPVVLQEVSTTLAPGTIIRHSPVAGQIAQRTSVTLTVAIAPEIVMLTVPNIVGQQWLAVSGQLEGFNVPQPATAPSSTIPPGHVISTNPPAGTQLESGSTVTVVVSSGPEPTVSPSPTPTETPTDPPTEGPGNGNGNNSQNANHNSGNSNNSNNSSNNSSNNGRGNSRRNRALAEAVTNVYHAIAQQTRGLLGWHLQT